MPSPLAHSSLLLAAVPVLRPAVSAWSRARRWGFYAALGFALLAPDLDIALGLALGHGPFGLHGGPAHSLLIAPLFGLAWAAAVRGLVLWGLPGDRTLGIGLLWALGAGAFAVHVLMDWLTPGRGVGMWWPINGQRVGSPIKLFVGVEHSDWRDWRHHGLTLATESGFALLVAGLGVLLAKFRSRTRRATPCLTDAEPVV